MQSLSLHINILSIIIIIATMTALKSCDDGDVINVFIGRCVQVNVSVNASVVEEVHLQVLNKVAGRVSARNKSHHVQNKL